MNAFITGSRVYGTPTEDSDIDLVVLLSEEDKAKLREIHGLGPIKFGKLNLILCDSDEQFDCWDESLNHCERLSRQLGRPITRDEAVAIHVQGRVNAFGTSKLDKMASVQTCRF